MDTKIAALAFVTAALMASGAQAQTPAAEKATDWSEAPAFAELDADKDGSITATEAEGTWLADAFALVDANKDGIVDEEEYKEAMS